MGKLTALARRWKNKPNPAAAPVINRCKITVNCTPFFKFHQENLNHWISFCIPQHLPRVQSDAVPSSPPPPYIFALTLSPSLYKPSAILALQYSLPFSHLNRFLQALSPLSSNYCCVEMASDNLMATEQPWQFRPSLADVWFADVLARDTDTLTKAVQRSIAFSASDGDGFSSEMVESLIANTEAEIAPLQTPTASGGGSENETSTLKRRRSLQPSGRVTKRKSRASKRTTTFITADPANFRQMVQQVTGARFGSLDGELPVAPVLKPEPRYGGVNQLQQNAGLPTFDTSAFFLEDASSSLVVPQPLLPPSATLPAGRGLNFDYSFSFPTLESWKVI